jgi:hypothetical protein
MTNTLRLAASAALIACGACNGQSSAPVPNTAELDGTWVHVRQPGAPPGFFAQWILSTHDTVVTAHGNWSGEAGPAGGVDGTGYYSRGVLHLDLTLSTTVPSPGPSRHQVFVGSITTASDLVGTLASDGLDPVAEHLHKQ